MKSIEVPRALRANLPAVDRDGCGVHEAGPVVIWFLARRAPGFEPVIWFLACHLCFSLSSVFNPVFLALKVRPESWRDILLHL